MSSTTKHIERLFKECYDIQRHGHCRDGPSFVAINDIEIGINNLRKAFEEEIINGRSERKK